MNARCLLILQLFTLAHTFTKERPNFEFFSKITTTIFYAPNAGYDPFWLHGDWVFGTTTPTSTTNPNITRSTRFPYPDVYPRPRPKVCGKDCAVAYRKITGQVCTHKVDNVYDPKYAGPWGPQYKKQGFVDWRLGGALDRNYDYLRTYPSYCEFLAEQCRVKVYHNMGLVFLHMGACLKDEDAFPPLYYGNDVQKRKRDYYRAYYNHLDIIFKGKGKHGRRSPVHISCTFWEFNRYVSNYLRK